jgi:hypothetical protein
VRAEQKRAVAGLQCRAHELLALDGDIEQLVAPAAEVETVEDGGGEGEHLPVAVEGGGFAPERAAQVGAGLASRPWGEHEEVGRDDVQDAAGQRASEPQRQEGHQIQ